jgi:RecB family endonuclease NucS
MPLYEVTDTGLRHHEAGEFKALGLYERADLQRLLRDDISALADDLLVIAEEFGEWEDARRRIDLLALDKTGRLVVIELKRTDDGGHMELQALRYAAMVSSMGFAEVAATYAAHCTKLRPEEESAIPERS